MQTTDQLKPAEDLRIAIIGPPGVGKTWLAGTFPNPLFIDTDLGVITLANHEFRTKYPGKAAYYVQVADKHDPKTGIFTEATGFWDVIKAVNEYADDSRVETLVMDSASSFSKLCSHAGLTVNKESKRSQSLDSGRSRKALLLAKQDFGAEMGLFEQFMDQFIQIPKHKIVIFHERDEINDKGAVVKVHPHITGAALRAGFGRWFHEVWQLEVIGSSSSRKRRLTTGSSALRPYLKSRIGLPYQVEDPDFEKLISLVHEAQAKIPVAEPRTT